MEKSHHFTRNAVIFGLMLCSLAAALEASSFKENHCWWTTIGAGYAHTEDPYGISLAATHTHRIGFQQLSLRMMHHNDIQIWNSSPDCYANEIGLLYGPYTHFTLFMKERKNAAPLWWSMSLSMSAGISYLGGITRGDYLYSEDFFEEHYTKKRLSTAGIPVQLEMRLIPSSKISIGFNGSANINPKESFYSGWIGLSYGIQRTRSDSLRYIAHKALSSDEKRRRTIPRIAFGAATLGSAVGAIVTHVNMRSGEGAREDYRGSRDGSDNEADYNRYNAMVKDETNYINSRKKARNVFVGLGAASLTGLSLSFAF